MFHTAVIFIKPDSTHAFETVQSLIDALSKVSITAKIATNQEHMALTQKHFPSVDIILFEQIPEENTVAFSVGGDGTFLFAAQQIMHKNCPILGINKGNRGFLAPFSIQDIPAIINQITQQKINIHRIPIWQTQVANTPNFIYFINEFILQRKSNGKMVKYTVSTDHMGDLDGRADGIIISSSTGSTAYNLTAGGTIIHPELNALSLTPICPHNLSHRSIVIPPSNVRITLNNDDASLNYDGFGHEVLKAGQTITISPSGKYIQLVMPDDLPYFTYLNNKLFT